MAEQKKFIPEVRVYTPADLAKRWFVYYYDENGKRIKVYGKINRYKSRENRLKEIERIKGQLQAQEIECKQSIKAQIYARVARKQNVLRQKTKETYLSRINTLFTYLDNDNPTASEIRSFFDHLLKTRHPSTYNKYLIDLKKYFTEIGLGYYFNDIDAEKSQYTPKQYFQPHQIKRLKDYISKKDPDLWLCIQFLFYCFIRPKESRSLQVQHVLFDEGKIIIPGVQSKNGKTQYVAIPEAFKKSLDYLQHKAPIEYIFKSKRKNTKLIGLSTMNNRHRRILERLGFPKGVYSLYSWKHTGAVMAVKNGIPVKDLQIQLRHHSLDQVDQYLRQLGVQDLDHLRSKFPKI